MSRLDLDCNKIKNNIENADVRSDYKLKEELGSGAYGVVRKAVHKKTKEEVAVKIVNKSKSLTNYRQQQQLETEISILTRAQHPNIISLKHVYQTSNRIFIVMTLVKGGELFDQLMKNGSFAEKDAAFISREILKGIEYLHTIDIVHRDLKPQNILCDVDSNQNITAIYITDFGLSKIVPQNPVMNSLVGTPHYIAPETITGGGYTKAVDLWAVGCIIYNLLSSMYPFSGDTPSEIFSNVSSYRVDFNDECFESVSQAAKDLISSLLTHWKTRLSAKEALNHPWFKHTQALSCDKVIKTDRLGVLKDAIQPLILAPPNPEPHDQLYLVEESSYNHWDDEDWTKFLEIATLLQVPKGQLIQHECESITEYGIIKEGSVRLERILSEEHKTLLATLGPKDALGTFGLAQYLRRTLTNSDSPKHRPQLQHQTSSNTLRNSSGNVVSPSASLYSTAETDVQLYVVPYDKLLDLVYSSPSLSFKFWKRLAGEFCRWYSQFCSRAKDEERKPVPVPETYGNTLTAGKKTKKPKKRSGITLPNSENMWHGERILAKLKSKWHMRGPSAPTLLDHVAGARSSIIVTKRSLILLASVFTLKFEARIPIECISELKITAENNLSNITNNQNQIQTQNNSPPLQSSSHGPPSPGIQSSASLLNVSRNQLPTHNASGIPMLSTTTTLSTLRSSSPSLSAMGHNNTGTIHTFVPPELSSTSAPQLCNQLSNLNSSKTLKLYYKKKDKTETAKIHFKEAHTEKEMAVIDLINSLWTERRQVASILGESTPDVTSGFTNTGALTEDDWKNMLASAELKFYKKDEVIIAEGQSAQAQLFFVQNGRCRVQQAQVERGDKVAVIGMVQPREIFGEISFLSRNRAPTATVVANEESVCLSLISGVHIQKLMRQEPGFAPRFYHYICQIISLRLCLTLCNL